MQEKNQDYQSKTNVGSSDKVDKSKILPSDPLFSNGNR